MIMKNRKTNNIIMLKPSDSSIGGVTGVILPEEVLVSEQKERIKRFLWPISKKLVTKSS